MAVPWARVWLLVSLFITFSFANTCTYNRTQDTSSHLRDTEGSLSLLLSFSRSVRHIFYGSNLDYTFLRQTVLNIFTGSSTFSEKLLLAVSFHYVGSTDVFLLAAFVIAVAFFLPLIFFAIFTYWKKCSHDIEEENEEEEHRHTSLLPQCITWSIALISMICLIPYVIFIILLLIGTERVEHSLTDTSQVVNQTLPQLVTLHREVLEQVNITLRNDARSTNDSIYTNLIQPFPEEIRLFINTTQLYTNITQLLEKVSYHTSEVDSIHEWAKELLNFDMSMNAAFMRSASLISNLTQLISICSNYTSNSSSFLFHNCTQLVSNSSYYLPSFAPLFPFFNTTQLRQLINITETTMGVVTPTLINDRINVFNRYLTDMESNISRTINYSSNLYLHPLVTNMLEIANHIHDSYSSISYGWPQSQETVEYYLGSGYLSNWNEFQFIITIAFSLALFVLIVGVALAIGRGLINVGSIYLYGQENVYLRASHHVGLTLRRLSLWIFVSGLVSAFFFIFVLCLASLVGRTCGRHGNYTELINEVIDNDVSWGGSYPLGTVYHDNRSYPLTLHSVISSCEHNSSSVHALELEEKMNLTLLMVDNGYTIRYITTTSNLVSNSITSSYKILGTRLNDSLSYYSSMDWSDSPSLPLSLFQPSFVGIETLQELIDDISFSLEETTPTSFNTTISHIQSILPHFVGVVNYYNDLRDEINRNGSLLMSAVGVANNISELLLDADYQGSLVSEKVKKIHYLTLIRTSNITKRWNDFSSQAQDTITCTTGLCYPMTDLYHQFSVLVCTNLLGGLDVYWSALFGLSAVSLICVVLLLLLASRFIDAQILREKNPNAFYISLIEQSISQIIGILWLILIYIINVWLVIAIAMDDQLCSGEADDSCCVPCMWGFGVVFLILSFPYCVSLRIYQWIMLHRLRVYHGARAQHVQRYWIKKINANLFYTQLGLFFLMHIPFLSIAGAYTTTRKILTVNSFFSLTVSLLSMAWFLLLLLMKRKELLEYMSLLQEEILRTCCRFKDKFVPATPTTNDVGGVPNGVTDIQLQNMGEVSPVPPPIRTTLPQVIEEEEEDVFEDIPPEEGVATLDIAPPPEVNHHPDDLEEEEEVGEAINNRRPSLWLDRRDDELQSGGVSSGVHYIRPEVTHYTSGVEVAHSSCRSDTTSTPRSSIYTSRESIPYHHSYSHIPGYTTDDSSYKDGYESYDSDPPYPPAIPFGSVRVDV